MKEELYEESGQTMVEMAFVLPLFLIFVFAIIEMSRAWGAKHSITTAAREGARILAMPYGAGLTYSSETDAKDAARQMVIDTMNSTGVPVTPDTKIDLVRVSPGPNGIYDHTFPNDDVIENTYTDAKRGERVGIQITHPFETPAPILLRMFNNDSGSPSQKDIKMGVTSYAYHE